MSLLFEVTSRSFIDGIVNNNILLVQWQRNPSSGLVSWPTRLSAASVREVTTGYPTS